MKRTAQIAYSLAAACFAIIIQFADQPKWWDENPWTATLIGFSIPSCVLGAWMSELRLKSRTLLGMRFIPHIPEVMKYISWCGIVSAGIALTMFLTTVSFRVAAGFVVGLVLLSIFAGVEEQDTEELLKKDDIPEN